VRTNIYNNSPKLGKGFVKTMIDNCYAPPEDGAQVCTHAAVLGVRLRCGMALSLPMLFQQLPVASSAFRGSAGLWPVSYLGVLTQQPSQPDCGLITPPCLQAVIYAATCDWDADKRTKKDGSPLLPHEDLRYYARGVFAWPQVRWAG
jgi:hypothetical protein